MVRASLKIDPHGYRVINIRSQTVRVRGTHVHFLLGLTGDLVHRMRCVGRNVSAEVQAALQQDAPISCAYNPSDSATSDQDRHF